MTESAPPDPGIQDATNRLLGDLQDDSINGHALPDRVFHYTDAGGLIGIVESGTLRATDFRFLNDESELNYAFDLARDVVATQYGERTDNALVIEFLNAASGDRPTFYANIPYYLACFTELENSLSQWRAYAGRQGYSIEFPGDICPGLTKYQQSGQNPGVSLLRVEYNPVVQRAYISGLIDRLIARVCWAEHLQPLPPATALATFMAFFWAQIERVSYRFKHPDFEVEREWRLVLWGDVHQESYRPGVHGITPYTSFPLASYAAPMTSPLPISSVRHGPTPTPGATAYSLDRLLSRNGYTDCQRSGSSTPVRL